MGLDLFVLRRNQCVKVSREALGAACSEWDTASRLLAPTHFAKADQSISPVVDYLHINLAEESGVLIMPSPWGPGMGGKKREVLILSV